MSAVGGDVKSESFESEPERDRFNCAKGRSHNEQLRALETGLTFFAESFSIIVGTSFKWLSMTASAAMSA